MALFLFQSFHVFNLELFLYLKLFILCVTIFFPPKIKVYTNFVTIDSANIFTSKERSYCLFWKKRDKKAIHTFFILTKKVKSKFNVFKVQ